MSKKAQIVVTLLILILIFGVVMVMDFPFVLRYKEEGASNIYEIGAHEMEKNMAVEGEIYYVLDCIAEEYETNWGIRTSDRSTKLYYLIAMSDTYVVLEVSKQAHYDTLDQICDETWQYLSGEIADTVTALPLEMRVKEMPSEVSDYLNEYFKEADWTESEIEESVETLMLSASTFDGPVMILPYVGVGLIAFAVVGGILFFVFSRRKKQEEMW